MGVVIFVLINLPIPTSAVWIIETSLAPSPMANVRIFSSSFTTFTIYAFCKGVERQHNTELQYLVNSKKGLVRFDRLSKMYVNVLPSTTNARPDVVGLVDIVAGLKTTIHSFQSKVIDYHGTGELTSWLTLPRLPFHVCQVTMDSAFSALFRACH